MIKLFLLPNVLIAETQCIFNMKKIPILTIMLLGIVSAAFAQESYDDDIYYNPKKDKDLNQKKKSNSNYIADFSSIDVDSYNMGGALIPVPRDTIGVAAENGEDFVYTQEIQKYYNPTIVIDNAELLADVLNNSYGNVDIVLNDNGIIGFGPYSYNWPYGYFGPSYGWGWNGYWGNWGWNIGWGYYDPWYAWGWGPSWGWYPGTWYPGSWYPGAWYPGGWYPGVNPSRPSYYYADYTPGGNRRTGAGGNWANNTRPGGNYSNTSGHRTTTGRYSVSANNSTSISSVNNHRVYNSTAASKTTSTSGRQGISPNGYSFTINGHRVSGGGNSTTNNYGNRTYNSNSTTSSPANNRSYNSTTNSNRSYNSTTNSNRSYNSTSTYNSRGSYSSGNSRSYSGGGSGARGRHR